MARGYGLPASIYRRRLVVFARQPGAPAAARRGDPGRPGRWSSSGSPRSPPARPGRGPDRAGLWGRSRTGSCPSCGDRGITDLERANAVLRGLRAPLQPPVRGARGETGPAWRPVPAGLDLGRACSPSAGAERSAPTARVRLHAALLQLHAGPGGRSLAGQRGEAERRPDGRLAGPHEDGCWPSSRIRPSRARLREMRVLDPRARIRLRDAVRAGSRSAFTTTRRSSPDRVRAAQGRRAHAGYAARRSRDAGLRGRSPGTRSGRVAAQPCRTSLVRAVGRSRRSRRPRTARHGRHAGSPSGHVTRTSAAVAGPSPTWMRPERAADVPAADHQLAAQHGLADPDLDHGPDGVPVGARLARGGRPASAPWARAPSAVPAPDVAPDPDRRAEVGLNEVRQAVEVEVRQRRAPAPRRSSRTPGRLGGLDERPVGLAEEQVRSGRGSRTPGSALMLPLDTNRSTKPSLLTSSNSGCQAVDGSASPPVNGAGAFDAALERDVAVGGLGRARPAASGACCRPGWSGTPRVGRRRSRPGSRCPCPRSACWPSRRRPCTGAAPRRPRIRHSCSDAVARSSGGRW